MVLDKITDVSNDINGLSISSKTRHNCVLLKLWNRDSKNILTETMSKDILDKYGDLSIKYKAKSVPFLLLVWLHRVRHGRLRANKLVLGVDRDTVEDGPGRVGSER